MLMSSAVRLEPTFARQYLKGILSHLGGEADLTVDYVGKRISVRSLLESIIAEIEANRK